MEKTTADANQIRSEDKQKPINVSSRRFVTHRFHGTVSFIVYRYLLLRIYYYILKTKLYATNIRCDHYDGLFYFFRRRHTRATRHDPPPRHPSEK